MQPSTKQNSFNPFLDTVRKGQAGAADVREAQFRVLKQLIAAAPASLGDVVKGSALPPVEGMNLIRDMEQAGLVESIVSPSDGTLLQLTAAGKEVAAALMAS